MPDPLRGVKVTIAGKEKTIKFDHEALRAAQRALGGMSMHDVVPLIKISERAKRGELFDLGDEVTTQLLACGLLHAEPEMSDTAASRLLASDPEAYYPVQKAIIAAWEENQTQKLAPYIREAQRKRAAPGEQTPPPSEMKPSGGDTSTAGPIGDNSSTPADGSTST